MFTFKSSRPSSEANVLRTSISLRFNIGLRNRSSSCIVNERKIRGILLFGAGMPGRSCSSGGGLTTNDSVDQHVYIFSQMTGINRILSCSSSFRILRRRYFKYISTTDNRRWFHPNSFSIQHEVRFFYCPSYQCLTIAISLVDKVSMINPHHI